MHVKFFLIILFLLCTVPASSKNRAFFGRVVDREHKAISYAIIQAEDRSEIFYCNDKGAFYFKANTDSIDVFIVSSQGYEPLEIIADSMAADSIYIVLKQSNTYLKGATVSGKGGGVREEMAGRGKSIHGASCYLTYKDELAIFLKADEKQHGILKEVAVYITKEGIPGTKFLLHIFEKDTVTGGPGEEITDTTLVLHARKGNEWVTADLSERYILVKGGVYIGVEWASGYENDYFPIPLKPSATNYYAGNDSLREVYNGQVLGLTWLSEAKPIVYRKYARNIYENKDADKWFLAPPLRGGHRMSQWICPMIYYIYTYIDK